MYPWIRSWPRLRRALPPVVTFAIFILIFYKVPFSVFLSALLEANYLSFLRVLLPFSFLYFFLDTVVLWRVITWFHGDIRFLNLLPVRAVDYLVTLINGKLSQGAMVVYLARQLQKKILEIASSILFLDLLQRTHLVIWATVGMILLWGELPEALFLIPGSVIAFWALFILYMSGTLSQLTHFFNPPDWQLLRTFRIASLTRYAEVVAWKAPLLLASVITHRYAMNAFGLDIPTVRLLATLPIIFLVGALPITVARLGTTQAAWLYFHGDVADPSILLAYSLAAHATFLLTNAALGAIFWPRAYRELFSAHVVT